MIHLKTLPGYPQHQSMSNVINQAVNDAHLLQEGGVDAILIENTDDDPHQKIVSTEVVTAFTLVADAVKKATSLPIGICVLWNDYKASLAIAKVTGCSFVRIPVFTEAVLTASGIIEGNPYDVISFREKIKALDIKILADVQVKHAIMLANRPITESATEALHFGADEIIITGRFTGDSPNLEELKMIREACPKASIVIGSGTTAQNFQELSKYADSAIVGTYFKPEGKIVLSRVKELTSLNR